jgi:hypothetical protein
MKLMMSKIKKGEPKVKHAIIVFIKSCKVMSHKKVLNTALIRAFGDP